MAEILYSRLSPYAAKARMAVLHVGFPAKHRAVDAIEPTDAFLEANPLGKLPVLLLDDGRAIHDSRVIMRFLDLWSDGRFYPQDTAAQIEAAQRESLADGVCDCLQAIMFEKRYRPEDKIHEDWIVRQWEKASRALKQLESMVGAAPVQVDAGALALRGMLGYLSVRFEGQWEDSCPGLVSWLARFDEAHPELAAVAPGL
jgi:glutathione S-transferase